MFEFISTNSQNITFLASIFAGLFAFIKWLDDRKQKLKNERLEEYYNLIQTVCGYKSGVEISPPLQICAVNMLLEYKEYYEITQKILDSNIWEMANTNMQQYILPEINKVNEIIKYNMSKNKKCFLLYW